MIVTAWFAGSAFVTYALGLLLFTSTILSAIVAIFNVFIQRKRRVGARVERWPPNSITVTFYVSLWSQKMLLLVVFKLHHTCRTADLL